MGRDSIVDRNVNIDEHREGRDQDQEAHIEAAGLHFRTLDTAAAKAQAAALIFFAMPTTPTIPTAPANVALCKYLFLCHTNGSCKCCFM